MKIDIIFGILLTLLSKKKVTATYLASKFEVSVRTVYRYVSILESNNIPITSKIGRNGGIILNQCVSLTSTYFTVAERLTILSLTQTIPDQSLKISIQTKLLAMQ